MQRKFTLLLLSCFIVLLLLAFFSLQTSFGKKILTQKITEAFEQNGIHIQMEEIQVKLPLTGFSEKIELSFPDGSLIEIEKIKFRISLFSLLKKKLSFRYITVEKFYFGSSTSSSSSLKIDALPFDFFAKKIEGKKMILEDLHSHEAIVFSLIGKVKINRFLQEVSFSFQVKEKENTAFLNFISSKSKNLLKGDLNLEILEGTSLCSFFKLPSISSFSLSSDFSGKWNFYQQKTPLSIHLKSTFEEPSLFHSSFDVESNLFLYSDLSLSCPFFEVKNSWLSGSGDFDLSKKLAPVKASFVAEIKDLSKLTTLTSIPLEGTLKTGLHFSQDSLSLTASSPLFLINTIPYTESSFELFASKKETKWEGNLEIDLQNKELPLHGTTLFSLENNHLNGNDISLLFASIKLGGEASFDCSTYGYKGSFFVETQDLRALRPLYPNSEFDGKIGGYLSLEGNLQDLSLETNLSLKNVRYKNALINEAEIQCSGKNVFKNPAGFLLLEAKNLFFQDLFLSKIHLVSKPFQEKQTFSAKIEGDWKHKLLLETRGNFSIEERKLTIDLNECFGYFLGKSFQLKSPFTLQKKQDLLLVTPFDWSLGEGDFSGQIEAESSFLSLKTEARALPLEVLSTLYPKMSFQGLVSFKADIQDIGEGLQGEIFTSFEKPKESTKDGAIKARGSIWAHLQKDHMQIHTNLSGGNGQFFDLTATLPFSYTSYPISFHLNQESPLTAELTMQGAIEDLFDFMNTASHKATGWVTTHLFLAKTLQNPSLQGFLELQNGSYENYYTGSKFKEVTAILKASENRLELSSLNAKDQKEGYLTSSGFFVLESSFPFEVTADLQNMHLLVSNPLSATFTGPLTIKGDCKNTTIAGDLLVEKAEFTLPDNLEGDIPTLPVTFINKPIHLRESPFLSKKSYPIYFDVDLQANDQVLLQGKGLESEWYGPVHIGGDLDNLRLKGHLTLKKGEFTFSGKNFTLRQGEIAFLDKSILNAYLKISGDLTLPSTTIIAQMQGPLSSLALTFQSIPALPTSSILSLILFNKDISEISPLQALQLAQTFVSLSGNGSPGVLEAIRKSIGIDRFTITSKEGTDEISLQIGWYLTHGVTLSLTQSATSSDVKVEVDLKKGLIFQAETQNQEEGKFSLKWNKNY